MLSFPAGDLLVWLRWQAACLRLARQYGAGVGCNGRCATSSGYALPLNIVYHARAFSLTDWKGAFGMLSFLYNADIVEPELSAF